MQSGIWGIAEMHLFPWLVLGLWGWPARPLDPCLQNAEPFLTSPPGCALDPCEVLSLPAISRISQTGNGLTPASSVFTQGLGFLYPSSFFPSKPKIFALYLCKEVHALGVGRTTSNPSDCVGIRFLPRVAQSREVLQVLWQWGEIAQKY